MKPVVLFGIILLVVGGLALAYQGLTYTTREKVIDVGPVHVTAERERTIPLRPFIGALALGSGVVLLVVGLRRT
jgi:hypothetical protein